MATVLGERVKRKEDPRLIQGRAHYVDDFKLDGMLYMAFVRSVHAHAKITSISDSAARAMPGVVDVLRGKDLEGKLGFVPCAAGMEGLKIPDHPCLAGDEVRYVGEPIAAVIARDRFIASDAANKIEVEYEPLPVVVNPEKALEKDSPLVHSKFTDNV